MERRRERGRKHLYVWMRGFLVVGFSATMEWQGKKNQPKPGPFFRSPSPLANTCPNFGFVWYYSLLCTVPIGLGLRRFP